MTELIDRELGVISDTLKNLEDLKKLEIRLKCLEVETNIKAKKYIIKDSTEYIHELDNIRKKLK